MAEKGPAADTMLFAKAIYPDAVAAFSHHLRPLAEVKTDCIVILDTNALLIPYATSPRGLNEVRQAYHVLVGEKRILIPGQVAREFAKQRAKKLVELHQQLLDYKSKLGEFALGKYPLLETFQEYQQALELEQKIDSLLRSYKTTLDGLVTRVRDWTWNDPVSAMYGELFVDAVFDPSFSEAEVEDERKRRYANGIPPGYKDSAKLDGGVGDLLIWKTILKVGAERKRHLIFVSGDEKTDWWHRSAGTPLYPRYELVDEYRRASDGRSFYIVSFSSFLNLFGAAEEVVNEVRQEEKASTGATAYARLGDDELKQRALDLVASLRKLLAQRRLEEERLHERLWQMRISADTEEEKHRLFHAETALYTNSTTTLMQEYNKNYKIEAALLAEELSRRLPADQVVKRDRLFLYEHPTNPLGVEEVADDLERLARSLP